ncbi:hypothetical protein [Streptomyces sp. NPDC046805]|uniref:hypothetical protein n=1 Tax=Streptomyces sp. NPDC046805 TaxID=3155134 RepID=UPI0033CC81A6
MVDVDTCSLDVIVPPGSIWARMAAARSSSFTRMQGARPGKSGIGAVCAEAALAEYRIHAGQAACAYSCRVPPSRASSYVEARDPLRIVDWFGQRTQRAGVREALVRPVIVVGNLELAQGVKEMVLVPDQCPLQQFSAVGLRPLLHERIRTGHSDAVLLCDGLPRRELSRIFERHTVDL